MTNFLRTNREKVSAAGLAVVMGLGLSACGERSDATTQPTVSASQEATPSATPSATQEVAPVVSEEEVLKQKDVDGCPTLDARDIMDKRFPKASRDMYDALKQQTVDSFAKQPAEQQVEYFMTASFDEFSKLRYSHFWQNKQAGAATKTVEGKYLNAYGPFCQPLTKDANPYQMVMQTYYAEQLADATSTTPDTTEAAVSSTPIDVVEATKLLGGQAYPGTRVYTSYAGFTSEQTKTGVIDATVVKSVTVLSDKEVPVELPGGSQVNGKEVIVQTADSTWKKTFVFVPSPTLEETTGVTGAGLWVLAESAPAKVTVN